MVTPWATDEPSGGWGMGWHERSLCRERFRGHNVTILNQTNGKRNKYPSNTQMAYACVWCPNNC